MLYGIFGQIISAPTEWCIHAEFDAVGAVAYPHAWLVHTFCAVRYRRGNPVWLPVASFMCKNVNYILVGADIIRPYKIAYALCVV